MPVKIDRLEIENVKRVKAVTLEPTPNGLTIVGGRNNQGKTSVLDAIAWALGGDRFKPSQARRDGSVVPPHLLITLSNGVVVERKGPNSDLKVRDPHGNKAGQQLLNEFVEALALDLPRFLASSSKDKAKTLLQIIGVGDQLYELDRAEELVYNERHGVGQIRDQKQSAADEMQSYPDAPAEPVSASELIKQQQDILARNGENQRKREQASALKVQLDRIDGEIADLEERIKEKRTRQANLLADLTVATKTAEQLTDESTAELEAKLADIDQINQKVRVNQAKALVEDEAQEYRTRYDELTKRIEEIRAEKLALLDGADLPMPGLSVVDGELTYNGHKWDGLSSSEQLRVATAIVRKVKPECGFVLLDKLEQMDTQTLAEFGTWLEGEGLQVIATRVSTGEECEIVIEDGYAVAAETVGDAATSGWKEGQF